tara:strand:- start:3038 stop:3403 length:366 start_codon:yes stop_codon:yes gene_type:complete
MGILDLYTSVLNSTGQIIGKPSPVASSKDSKLHATKDGESGYSLNGDYSNIVNIINNTYNNGGAISIPSPSELDINGKTPTTSLKDINIKDINNTFLNGEYKNSIPNEIWNRIEINNKSYI